MFSAFTRLSLVTRIIIAIILGVLASGRGSDLQSIIDAIENGQIKTKIGVVLTDKPEAMALERARKAGIPAVCVDRPAYVPTAHRKPHRMHRQPGGPPQGP